METRLTTSKKRKAEEYKENKILQKQMFENINQPDNGSGPRDIVIGDDQSLTTNDMECSVKQEVKMETEVENEFEFEPNTIKIEVKGEEVVVVTEEEVIFDDNKIENTSADANLEISDAFDPLKHSEDLQIATKSKLFHIEDVTRQNISLEQVLETEKEQKITIDDSNLFIDATYEARLVTETQLLEKILPRKVWIRVFEALEDSDFLNTINSSPFCRSLLSKARIFSIYKLVLEVVIKNLAGLGGFQTKTEYNDVLLSRTVCKKWKKTVDTVVERWFAINNLRTANISQPFYQQLSSKYWFSNFCGQVEKFIEKFKVTHCSSTDNPVFGRHLNIKTATFCTWLPFETGLSPIATILDKYGWHVLTCKITILTNQFRSPNYHTIFGWLQQMPNLYSLNIYCTRYAPFQDQFGDDDFLPLNLKNLKLLTLEDVSPNCFHKILNASPNISSLNVSRYYEFTLNPNYLASLKCLNNLESLQITVESRHDQIHVYKLNSPLKKLNIRYRISDDWAKNLEKISKFSQTLESLRLFGSSNESMTANLLHYSCHGRLYLPKLKNIYLGINNFICLDFLLPAKLSLEEITIRIDSVDLFGDKKQHVLAIEKKQIIQFFGYEGKLLDSNIWKMFPNLKKVCLYLNTLKIEYTRREWTNHVKMLIRQFSA